MRVVRSGPRWIRSPSTRAVPLNWLTPAVTADLAVGREGHGPVGSLADDTTPSPMRTPRTSHDPTMPSSTSGRGAEPQDRRLAAVQQDEVAVLEAIAVDGAEELQVVVLGAHPRRVAGHQRRGRRPELEVVAAAADSPRGSG